MILTKKKGDASTLRKVWNDEKTELLGVVGTFSDFIKAGIVEQLTEYSLDTWCCIPAPGRVDTFDGIGKSREEAVEKCIFGHRI